MELAPTIGLTILNLTSLVLVVSPRLLNEPYAFPIRTTSVAAPFVRVAFVPRMIPASTYYVLIEFFVALVSIGLFALEYSELPVASIQARTNNSLA
jgi:energy-coupling factor transporter transmembrane protein EcfT